MCRNCEQPGPLVDPLVDTERSACLGCVGLPGYAACVLVRAAGSIDMVLVEEDRIGDPDYTYNRDTPAAPHEQPGPLPLEYVRRITASHRQHRCGRTRKSGGRCRTPVAHPGDACTWHRTPTTERTS